MSETRANLDPLLAEVAAFCEARDWDQFHDIKELAIGVSTEAAELLEIFRFRSKAECEELLSEPQQRERIEDEMADVFFFLLRTSGRYKIDLVEAIRRKMKKNAAKYPVEKAKGSNRKYTEF